MVPLLSRTGSGACYNFMLHAFMNLLNVAETAGLMVANRTEIAEIPLIGRSRKFEDKKTRCPDRGGIAVPEKRVCILADGLED
ncbi:hypothetical protein [Rhizobium tubonense]|uniref:Uncharacterized protein n=1 Tax=Rhizobium tubonense TaxID=484088 RepID=A0A2W4ERZ9_9HYPH|nr:hypothetical protein [Rhizobium tubonense]PZM13793.1 hypothetical protein CPY51_13040 [Rhizobium tubonense]